MNMTGLKYTGPPPSPPTDANWFFPHLDQQLVTVRRCYFYISFLEQFWSLLNRMTVYHQRHYLARAEFRYAKWIRQFTYKSSGVPPLDVAFLWHVHCLSPFHYYEDLVLRLSCEEVFEYAFPLGQLRQVFSEGPSPEDLVAWETSMGNDEPYTLTVENMYEGTFRQACYRCRQNIEMPWLSYYDQRYGIDSTRFPHACSESTNGINLMDMARLKLEHDLTNPNGPTVAGTLLNADGTVKEKLNKMITKIRPIGVIIPENEMDSAYERQIQQQLQFLGAKYEYDANELLYAIRTSYQGNPSPFSIDLIHGVARQKRFYDMVMTVDWHGYEALPSAIRRYHDFLVILRDNHDFKPVPTLEIDVAFHTHMLCASLYRKFTLKHLKRVVNHDDAIPPNQVKQYAKAWQRKNLPFRYCYKHARTSNGYAKGSLSLYPEIFGFEYHAGEVYVPISTQQANIVVPRTLNHNVVKPPQIMAIELSVHSRDVDQNYTLYPSLGNLQEIQNFIMEGAKNSHYGYIGSINAVSGGLAALIYNEKKNGSTKLVKGGSGHRSFIRLWSHRGSNSNTPFISNIFSNDQGYKHISSLSCARRVERSAPTTSGSDVSTDLPPYDAASEEQLPDYLANERQTRRRTRDASNRIDVIRYYATSYIGPANYDKDAYVTGVAAVTMAMSV